jgi:hypothetical protein
VAKPVANPPRPGTKLERLSKYTDSRGRKTPDREVDAMAEDSFPASDPPSFTGAHAGKPKRDRREADAPKIRRRGIRK